MHICTGKDLCRRPWTQPHRSEYLRGRPIIQFRMRLLHMIGHKTNVPEDWWWLQFLDHVELSTMKQLCSRTDPLYHHKDMCLVHNSSCCTWFIGTPNTFGAIRLCRWAVSGPGLMLQLSAQII